MDTRDERFVSVHEMTRAWRALGCCLNVLGCFCLAGLFLQPLGPQETSRACNQRLRKGNCRYLCVQLAVASIFNFFVTSSHDLAMPFLC